MTATDQAPALEIEQHVQDLLFREARTANTFSDEPVTDEQVRAIYDLVKWGPTSMNQQPLRVVLVRSDEAKQRLLPLMGEGNRDKTGKAPLVALLGTDTEFHEKLPRLFPHFPGARDVWTDDDFRTRHALLNASLQIGYFIVGVRAAGLAAGPMTGFDADAVTKEFFPEGQQALVAVNLGKPGPDAWFERLPRLDYDEVVTTV
ncbi:3-hydroxypropanoate dehydrogenase [Saccharopolyspora erythraea NRRL 2338]|uniref:NADH dehydrogenase / NAD(P)H nitroreductase n=2 Tax=Saccharopolyspora erythraea TaxID=1836 RepID=A4F7Y1_SACEN|nr:malonic semialdehyde reductase [Saccharopolyspora erythraea]EQD85131.1 malonic semialdehyde reductase [Saccharopolyspora erythraea D]PFG93952.1 3-hydroxypropanoate dehydrogenase [Saccharopolyspora erythraea NRRL 2338]QRK90771.1 malonic semialdehyde reductase [Saccharopolyspora erythraea]CAM00155.1 putative NADH dehydrogenase / NAD(P)H nitroreductase [Saccharopolyspora erythraea NRRL 2338]